MILKVTIELDEGWGPLSEWLDVMAEDVADLVAEACCTIEPASLELGEDDKYARFARDADGWKLVECVATGDADGALDVRLSSDMEEGING